MAGAGGSDQFPPLDVQVHWGDHDVTVIVKGELGCVGAPVLSARLVWIVIEQPQRLVLDMAGVTFMDCSGITPIARACSKLLPGCLVVLRSPTPRVRRFLKMTQMDQVCQIQDG